MRGSKVKFVQHDGAIVNAVIAGFGPDMSMDQLDLVVFRGEEMTKPKLYEAVLRDEDEKLPGTFHLKGQSS